MGEVTGSSPVGSTRPAQSAGNSKIKAQNPKEFQSPNIKMFWILAFGLSLNFDLWLLNFQAASGGLFMGT